MGTGGSEPAFGTQPGRDDPLVYFYQQNKRKAEYLKQLFHLIMFINLVKLFSTAATTIAYSVFSFDT